MGRQSRDLEKLTSDPMEDQPSIESICLVVIVIATLGAIGVAVLAAFFN